MPSEWISVKEKEPCLGSLIYDTNGDISIATEIFTIKTKNGVVYIPKFIIEKILKELKEMVGEN